MKYQIKKLIAIFMAVALITGLCGCNYGNNNKKSTSDTSPTSTESIKPSETEPPYEPSTNVRLYEVDGKTYIEVEDEEYYASIADKYAGYSSSVTVHSILEFRKQLARGKIERDEWGFWETTFGQIVQGLKRDENGILIYHPENFYIPTPPEDLMLNFCVISGSHYNYEYFTPEIGERGYRYGGSYYFGDIAKEEYESALQSYLAGEENWYTIKNGDDVIYYNIDFWSEHDPTRLSLSTYHFVDNTYYSVYIGGTDIPESDIEYLVLAMDAEKYVEEPAQ